jgi:hypothetical protein
MTDNESFHELTVSDKGWMHPIDPRMNREPAGSLLLARAAAIRNAQNAALRQVALPLATTISPSFAELVERELVPRSSEFVHDRQVVTESRTEPSAEGAFYRVQLRVVLDLRRLHTELDRLRR